MRTYKIRPAFAFFVLVISMFWSFIVESAAKQDPIYKMAEIMHRLKHFPSPAGKETLQAIVNDKSTTENQRILATAMLNLQHRAIDSDRPKLKSIMSGNSATAEEKTLASIIYNLDHRPTKDDKQKLEQILK